MNQNEIKNSKFAIRLPIIIALTLVAGIFIGAKFFAQKTDYLDVIKSSGKFKEILTYIDRSYVDPVNTDSLANYGIMKMLEKLDPHTAYLPAEEAEIALSELQNGFDGIGVEFNLFNDTVFVVSPLSGGPSEAAGIQTGDAIIEANGTNLTGEKVNTNLIFKTLRGERGSTVKMKIKRSGNAKLLDFTVVRDKIPTFSVAAAYLMKDKQTGYLKITRFSDTTYKEFVENLKKLKNQGMTRLILDLRGNPGGYLERATSIADEFIGGNGILVFTEGKDERNNQKMYARKDGIYEKNPLIVLIDEGSASASEIVSGALQDYDRALLVGRRTFGKGLVQAPISLSDGSELRLTVSRYYIPSGRSIQKPYVLGGDLEDYYSELLDRQSNGEYYTADSIKNDNSKKYKTTHGRTVYGGGGVTPDVFVKRDTTYLTNYLIELFNQNVIREYTLQYASAHKAELNKMGFDKFLTQFDVNNTMLQEIIKKGVGAGVKLNTKEFERSKAYIQNQVKAQLARTIWKDENGLSNTYYQVINNDDDAITTALNNFGKASELLKLK